MGWSNTCISLRLRLFLLFYLFTSPLKCNNILRLKLKSIFEQKEREIHQQYHLFPRMSIQPTERRSNWSYDNSSNGTATRNTSYWIVAKEKYVRRKRNRVEKTVEEERWASCLIIIFHKVGYVRCAGEAWLLFNSPSVKDNLRYRYNSTRY